MRLGVLGHLGRLVAAEQWTHTTWLGSSGSRHRQHTDQQQHRLQRVRRLVVPVQAQQPAHKMVSVDVSSHSPGCRFHDGASCSFPAGFN